jgi:prepilin-type N-terminal cleavage/methylation domain-containing protein
MKTGTQNSRRAFTLVELLIVIVIIAILAGLSIPVANIVIDKANRTRADAMCKSLVLAVGEFQTEYNRLPNPNKASADTTYDSTEQDGIIKILMGEDSANNPRVHRFLTPPLAKDGLNGLTANGDVVDPWADASGKGQPYHMTFDYDENHSIQNPVKGQTGKFSSEFVASQPEQLKADVAVYSDGNPRRKSSARKPVTSW